VAEKKTKKQWFVIIWIVLHFFTGLLKYKMSMNDHKLCKPLRYATIPIYLPIQQNVSSFDHTSIYNINTCNSFLRYLFQRSI